MTASKIATAKKMFLKVAGDILAIGQGYETDNMYACMRPDELGLDNKSVLTIFINPL